MGFKQLEAAYRLTAGKPSPKAVLLAMAWHSCDVCGTTWVPVRDLVDETELGRTTVSDALSALTRDGWLNIGRFPHGGRGLSTEYVVTTHLRELSPAPCGKCRENMKKPPASGWFYSFAGGNQPAGGGFAAETNRLGHEKGRQPATNSQ